MMRTPILGALGSLVLAAAACDAPPPAADDAASIAPPHNNLSADVAEQAFGSWDAMCSSLVQFQAYGADAMIEQCKRLEEPPSEASINDPLISTCDLRWIAWGICMQDNEYDHDACIDERVQAMACSSCVEGDIDAEGADQVLVVDAATCPSPPSTPTGSNQSPFCTVGAAVTAADASRAQGLSTKIAVCPGTYREEVIHQSPVPAAKDSQGRPLPESSAPRVTLESVVQHAAVMTGAEDWSDDWSKTNKYVHLENWIPDFAMEGWASSAGVATNIGGPYGTTIEAFKTPSGEVALNNAADRGEGRWIFSVYAKPVETPRLGPSRSQITLTLEGDAGVANAMSVVLPLSDCDAGPGGRPDESGVEEVGNGWYRVWVASSLLNRRPTTKQDHEALSNVRIQTLSAVTGAPEDRGMYLWHPQLEHEALGSFRSDPEPYTAHETEGFDPPLPYTFPTYSRSGWTHDWGLVGWAMGCPAPPPIVRRGEQVFVDGEPLRQVLTAADLRPGTFYLDDGLTYEDPTERWSPDGSCGGPNPPVPSQCSVDDPCTLHIAPVASSATVMPRSREPKYVFDSVEVSERPQTLVINNAQNWTVRGMRFQHTGGGDSVAYQADTTPGDTQPQVASAFFGEAIGLRFTDNLVTHNSRVGWGLSGALNPTDKPTTGDPRGFVVFGEGIELARNQIRRNGLLGSGVFNAREIKITDEVYSHNNWRGWAGNYSGNFVGTTKMGWFDGATIDRFTAEDNYGAGLWFDHFSVDVELVDYVALRNKGKGLFLEAVPDLTPSGVHGVESGPPQYTFNISGAVVESNGVGIVGADTSYVEIHDSSIGMNHDPSTNGAQVAWLWTGFREAVDGDEPGPLYLPLGPHHVSLERNNYETCGTDRFYAYSQVVAENQEAAGLHFLDTLQSNCNEFVVDDSATLVSLEGDCGQAVVSGQGGCAHGFFNSVEELSALDPDTELTVAQYDLDWWRDYTAEHTGSTLDGDSIEAGELMSSANCIPPAGP